MPDRRTHRGPHPSDAKLFGSAAIASLRTALADFSLLLTKGYADKSSLKLVGDRFSLTERQRLAIMRSACSDQQLTSRRNREVKIVDLAGQPIIIDGYNILITIEAAMSSGVIFKGRDGCFRDLASIHGTYRKVTETIPAVLLIGKFLKEINVANCLLLLDSPVSNSGRLKTLIAELAEENNWDWEIELLPSPDAKLIKTDLTVASSDSVVLDGCKSWVNLARAIIEERLPKAPLVNLS
ncbi:MAG: DUF434 domain-containing protein [Planctomycetota bacterium]|nr:MAG: DUF434 domain-containing protein [Planctomycetota bacterium]